VRAPAGCRPGPPESARRRTRGGRSPAQAVSMILPDVNLLVHAYNTESRVHGAARTWWEGLLNGTRPVGLAWAGVLGFVRIATHRQILTNPMPVALACS